MEEQGKVQLYYLTLMPPNADQQVDRAPDLHFIPLQPIFKVQNTHLKLNVTSPLSLKTFGCTQGLQWSGGQNLNEPLSIFPGKYRPFEIWQLHRTQWSTHRGESIGGWARQRGHCADSNQALALPLFFLLIQVFSNYRKGSNEMWWIMGRKSA